jgi:hypothetical protein
MKGGFGNRIPRAEDEESRGIGRRLSELCSGTCCLLPRRGSRFLFFGRRRGGRGVWCRGGGPRLLGREFASEGELVVFPWNRKYMGPEKLDLVNIYRV